jgi:hypothetical protein
LPKGLWKSFSLGSPSPLDPIETPKTLPSWLTDADVDFYTGEFARTGFRGGLNWYRNIDRNW